MDKELREKYCQVKWPPAWKLLEDEDFNKELQKELGPGHKLYNIKVVAIARCYANDDVLFAVLDEDKPPLAAVHLTWSGKVDSDSEYPSTGFFNTIEEFLEFMEDE